MREVVGFVETAESPFIKGWIALPDGEACTVSLFVQGVCWGGELRLGQARMDAINAGYPTARDFSINLEQLRIPHGHYVARLEITARSGREYMIFRAGTTGEEFELNVFPAHLLSGKNQELLIDRFADRADIRRALVADRHLDFRPDQWAGDFIFVDGLPGSESSRYRIWNIVEELTGLGYDCVVLPQADLWRIRDGHYKAGCIHFFRTPFWDPYKDVAELARAAGVKIGYDTDDYVFDPEIMPYIDGVRHLSPEQVEKYREGMHAYAEFIKFADYVTCSTPVLRDKLSELNSEVSVVRNSISPHYMRVWPKYQESRSADKFIIGYYSGTKTHEADFSTAASGLAEALEEHPDVRLRIVGELDFHNFPGLEKFRDRIEFVPFMPHVEMMRNMSDCSIVIAPLEMGNPYCEAKSELKFFEAALVGVATVVSATLPFRECVKDGETGRLVYRNDEWRAALSELISNPALRKSMQKQAYDDVVEAFSARRSAMDFLRACGAEMFGLAQAEGVAGKQAKGDLDWRPEDSVDPDADFAFVVPEIAIGGGGHRKILRICYDLEQLGYSVSVYVMGPRSSTENREIIRKYFYPFNGTVFRYNGSIRRCNYLVATAWNTAFEVNRHRNVADQTVYFVQDFEPMFMPVGTGYLKALATYQFGFKTICLGDWIGHRLNTELGVTTHIIPFPIDREIYHPKGSFSKVKSVTLFGRPSQERRAFDLATEALGIFARSVTDVQINFYGEPHYPPQRFSYTNKGLFTNQNGLADLYSESTAGFCISPTNPSLVGYEMVACGAALVDVEIPGSHFNFGGAAVAFRAIPTPEALAEQLKLAVFDEDLRQERIQNGLDYVSNMPRDDEMHRYFLAYLGERSGADLKQFKTVGGRAPVLKEASAKEAGVALFDAPFEAAE